MDGVCELISQTVQSDSIGNQVVQETTLQVFCDVKPINQSEFFHARTLGINPAVKIEMFFGDYSGQETLEWEGQRYVIYRTFTREDDTIELYAERKLGRD